MRALSLSEYEKKRSTNPIINHFYSLLLYFVNMLKTHTHIYVYLKTLAQASTSTLCMQASKPTCENNTSQ